MADERQHRARLQPTGDVVETFGDTPGDQAQSCSDLVKRNVLMAIEVEAIKQADLARTLGWSRAQLSKVLNSDRPIRVDEVVALAWALSIAPISLMTPWDRDTALRVRLDGVGKQLDLTANEAFDWMAGVLPAPLMRADHERYMRLMPPGVQARPEVLNALRESRGVRVTASGVEWLSEDGTVALTERRKDH